MALDPYHRFSNEAERTHKDFYDDFELKKPSVSMVYTKYFSVATVNLLHSTILFSQALSSHAAVIGG